MPVLEHFTLQNSFKCHDSKAHIDAQSKTRTGAGVMAQCVNSLLRIRPILECLRLIPASASSQLSADVHPEMQQMIAQVAGFLLPR